jgi:hypothetical protein
MIYIIILLPLSIKNRKRKIKQRWSAISTISTKRIITSHLYSLNTNKTTTYADGNQGPFLGQAQHCDSVKLALLSVILSFFTSFFTIFLIFYRKIIY